MKNYLTYKDITDAADILVDKLKSDNCEIKCIVAVTRGGMLPALLLSQKFNIRDIRVINCASYTEDNTQSVLVINHQFEIPNNSTTLVVDDLVDSGNTLSEIKRIYPEVKTAVLYTKCPEFHDLSKDYYGSVMDSKTWIVFPWECN